MFERLAYRIIKEDVELHLEYVDAVLRRSERRIINSLKAIKRAKFILEKARFLAKQCL